MGLYEARVRRSQTIFSLIPPETSESLAEWDCVRPRDRQKQARYDPKEVRSDDSSEF